MFMQYLLCMFFKLTKRHSFHPGTFKAETKTANAAE